MCKDYDLWNIQLVKSDALFDKVTVRHSSE